MRWLRLAGLLLFGLGAALIAGSVATGEGRLFLLLIFPVFTSSGALGLLGIVATFVGLFLTMLPRPWTGAATVPVPPLAGGAPATPNAAPPPRFGGVVMLGPIPLVFGSDPAMAKWMALLG